LGNAGILVFTAFGSLLNVSFGFAFGKKVCLAKGAFEEQTWRNLFFLMKRIN